MMNAPDPAPLADPSRSDRTETLANLRQLMRDFVAEREWEKFHTPRNLAASVCVEAGELLEHFQWLTAEEAAVKIKQDAIFKREVGEELADVLMYLVSLANALDLDIASTVHAKMQKNRTKYPPEKFRGRYERPAQKQ